MLGECTDWTKSYQEKWAIINSVFAVHALKSARKARPAKGATIPGRLVIRSWCVWHTNRNFRTVHRKFRDFTPKISATIASSRSSSGARRRASKQLSSSIILHRRPDVTSKQLDHCLSTWILKAQWAKVTRASARLVWFAHEHKPPILPVLRHSSAAPYLLHCPVHVWCNESGRRTPGRTWGKMFGHCLAQGCLLKGPTDVLQSRRIHTFSTFMCPTVGTALENALKMIPELINLISTAENFTLITIDLNPTERLPWGQLPD